MKIGILREEKILVSVAVPNHWNILSAHDGGVTSWRGDDRRGGDGEKSATHPRLPFSPAPLLIPFPTLSMMLRSGPTDARRSSIVDNSADKIG